MTTNFVTVKNPEGEAFTFALRHVYLVEKRPKFRQANQFWYIVSVGRKSIFVSEEGYLELMRELMDDGLD